MKTKILLIIAMAPMIAWVAKADDMNENSNPQTYEEKKDTETNHGGLFVEPMLTYQWGDTTVSYPAPFSDSKESIKGFGLGVKVGFHVYESVFLALEGRWARPEYDSSALGEKVDASAYNAGLTLGVQTPMAGLRVWGTYILAGELDPESINNVDVKFKDLKGYRIGAGLYISTASVNLEYQDAKYGNTEIENAGGFTGNSDDITGKDKSYILSVSFPISL